MNINTKTVVCSGVSCVDGQYTNWGRRYQFHNTDAGRAYSKRSKQKNDCTVRALAIVANVSYDEAYDYLAERGRKCGRGADFPKNRNDDRALGLTLVWRSFPAIKGQQRMDIDAFCKIHSRGVYIARVAKHVFAVIDGVVHDSWKQRPNRCVYGCWQVQ